MAWWYGKLPAVVPSHFDGRGFPDGTMTKNGYVVLMAAVHIHMVFILGAISFVMPKSPDSLINLPNKAYWLAPERRSNTIQQMQNILLNIGTMTMVFMGALFHLSSQVAVKERVTINPEFAWFFGIYMAAILGMVFSMFWKYRLPGDANDGD